MAHDENQQLRLERLDEVEARAGLKSSEIYKGIKTGTFPAPVKVTGKAVRWVSHEVDAWIRQRIEERAARAVNASPPPTRRTAGSGVPA